MSGEVGKTPQGISPEQGSYSQMFSDDGLYNNTQPPLQVAPSQSPLQVTQPAVTAQGGKGGSPLTDIYRKKIGLPSSAVAAAATPVIPQQTGFQTVLQQQAQQQAWQAANPVSAPTRVWDQFEDRSGSA